MDPREQDSSIPSYEYQNQRDRFVEPTKRIFSIRPNRAWFEHQALNVRDFFIVTWLDWLTFVIIGATAAGVWAAPRTFDRLFPVTDPSNAIYWPSIAYPYVEPIFSSALAGILSALIPIVTFLLAQLWQHSFLDFGSAVLGLAYAMVTGTCFQVILKKTIGGLRPHFLAVCQPVIPPGMVGKGFEGVMFTAEEVCTGSDRKAIENALTSFPSGHAEVAFAGLGYLAIYLFAHLRITSLSRRRGSHWRLLVVIAPLLLATYLASTLVLGYHHHAYDVFFGALIGWVMAFMGYRTVFMGIVDARWNTVPYLKLPPRGEAKGRKSDANGWSAEREETARDDERPVTNGGLYAPGTGGRPDANGSAV